MEELSAKLRSLVNDWLEWDKNEKTRKAIERLVAAGDVSSLEKKMLQRMTFGTAGLRGVMTEGFACMNDLVIIQSSQGLAKYVVECLENAKEKGVVISFDGRHNSARFALLTAQAFLQLGMKVFLFNKITPTPYVPFTVTEYGAACGVMITASHNPKDDNGYKVYWSNGAQLLSPHDKKIQASIEENLKPWPEAWAVDSVRKNSLCEDPTTEINEKYMKILESRMYDREMNVTCETRFTFTSLHGVANDYITEAFQRCGFNRTFPVEEQMNPDPDFPTVKFPNPEEGKSALDLSINNANRNGCRVILANDPDADRLAVAERIGTSNEFRVFTGDNIGALLGWWIWTSYRSRNAGEDVGNCYMIASTVSSKVLASIAKKEGFHFEETLTGFKWMANRGLELCRKGKQVLLAYEEAIGYMCGNAVWDKDGISAAMHVAELVAYLDRQGLCLQEKLNEIYDEYGLHISNNSYFLNRRPTKTKEMFENIRNFRNSGKFPTKIGRFEIVGVRDLTMGVDTTKADHKPVLPVSSSSEMITFYFSNGANITIRTSGTEPKIKWYSEFITKPRVPREDWPSVERELAELVSAMVEELYEPEKNGFEARPS